MSSATNQSNHSDGPVVIGLAGGVGAGKSAVAEAFAELGCLVTNADKEVTRLLQQDAIRDTLVEWWGDQVLAEDGALDRSAVAAVIFSAPEERSRLEKLLHPKVIDAHRLAIEDARERNIPAVVIDAPLLFEAGVDALCDAVVYIDTPRDIREARVRDSRGWGPEELDRREKSQMPLEIKRARSHYGVRNDVDFAELKAQIRDVFAAIMSKQGRSRP